MTEFLDFLTKYSNLILAVITGIYVYLTYRMVSEMKVARENQSDANLIAFPVSLKPIYAQVQLENAGPGPAFDIELIISLAPALQTSKKIWHHPAFLIGQKEHFLIPQENDGQLASLRQIAEKHTNLIIDLKWKNVFGREKNFSKSYNLNDLMNGWYNAGHLFPPEDIPSQMQETTKFLEKIHEGLDGIHRDLKVFESIAETYLAKSKVQPPKSRKSIRNRNSNH